MLLRCDVMMDVVVMDLGVFFVGGVRLRFGLEGWARLTRISEKWD